MFSYYAAPVACRDSRSSGHIAVVPAGVKTARELCVVLGEGLAFPPYYGANFDAFWDSVRTLEGIDEKRVVILHEDFPALPRPDARSYVALLRDTVLFWRRRAQSHSVEAWFPLPARGKVRAILRSLPPPMAVE